MNQTITTPYLERELYKMYNFEDMLNQALEAMPEKTHLAFVDYDDQLSDDQVRGLIEGREVYEDAELMDWISEIEMYGARYEIDNCMEHLRSLHDEDEEALEWIDENEFGLEDYLRDEAHDRDDSDAVRELARRTPDVELMIPLIDEDNADWADERKATQLMAALGTTDERYYWITRDLIAEAPTDLGMAWIVFEASVEDIYDGKFKEGTIKITNPTVIYGNPFTGGVWDVSYEGLTYHGDASTIMRDGAWGYSLGEIYGGHYYHHPYHTYWVSDDPLPKPVDAGEIEHMETLGNYIMEVC